MLNLAERLSADIIGRQFNIDNRNLYQTKQFDGMFKPRFHQATNVTNDRSLLFTKLAKSIASLAR
jgi:hypothetical protein